ncbi:MAG TPA: tripartite tricarboxylate transporter substrate binding protein [Burkholderiales bacterium]|jgi:tripartite-type tricarboxylate transporter receptor subunit TctC|nr:tripartite tricarboxylate transporter substrate binding protein [Burkholderiales bacterium]
MMKSMGMSVAVLCGVLASAAFAQDYPSKSVRVVVPWAAGGSTDSIGRILAAKLTEYNGHQFIIDNRAGATGTIGHLLVAKSPPDGYTLLIGSNSTFAIAPHLYKLQYDNDSSFAPIELLAVSPQILSVHPSTPVKNVKELIALAKAQPGALVFSSAGPGSTSHLATELLMNTAGLKMIHVPYKGGGPSAQALLGGETMLSFVDVITALPFAKAGRLRPLAASTTRRSAMMPELPTISESGLKGFESSTTFAAFAPAGTSREIVAKLNKDITRALNAPDVKEKLFNQGIETVGGTPEEFVAYNKAESAKWGKVIREQGIKIE